MNDLTIYQPGGLPAQPADLAKFIIVAQEKVKAVKAEIRAIQKLELTKEVYDQKMKEQREFQEVILLAYQRMGEITREMPTNQGARTDRELLPTSGKKFDRPKSQAIQDLGFSTSQVNRMEQMAAHPDVVEEVIAESQAGQTEATQGEVLRRIKERERGKVIDLADVCKERFERDMAEIDEDAKWAKAFVKATHAPFTIADHLDRVAAAVWRNAEGNISSDIEDIDLAIQMLRVYPQIRIYGIIYIKGGGRDGEKSCKSWTISDEFREVIKDEIPERQRTESRTYQRKPGGGRKALSKRRVLEGIFYVLRTGCQWKAAPGEYGAASSIHQYFQEWAAAGLFERRGLEKYDEMVCLSQ